MPLADFVNLIERLALRKWWLFALTAVMLGYFGLPPLWNMALSNEGVANLVGAALGAGITVFGSFFVARFEMGARERSYDQFAIDAVTTIRTDALALRELADPTTGSNDWSALGRQLLMQVENIRAGIELLDRNSASVDLGSYRVRLAIRHFKNAIHGTLRTLDGEVNWLKGRLSEAIVANARSKLDYSASEIARSCLTFLRKIGAGCALPSRLDLMSRLSLLEEPTPEYAI